MGVRSFITDWSERRDHVFSSTDQSLSVNPATGLPLLDGAVDVGGNPFGIIRHRNDDPSCAPICDHYIGSHHAIRGPASLDCHHDHWVSSISDNGAGTSWPDHFGLYGASYEPERDW